MRERTEQMIHSMNKNRHKRRRINAFITALAVLTGGNVFWELRETGMAVTEDDLCTMEAHEHSDNCYDSDGTLICGMDEHIHTADCYSDAEADTETPEVWEMSFTAPENAARQEQAALIAESQLGYTESTDNFILSENGVKQGYTRYGEWYGNPYGDWNTMFTYFCMYYAGVSAEEFPYGGNATTWQAKLKESELLLSPDSEPQRGNIILLDTDADGEADLTGIITDTEELLTVIEGDCDNTVAEVKYQYDDSQILGYVALPEPDTPAEAEAVPMEFSAESPSGIQVSASAEKGTFPEDAVMTVSDISREEAMQAAENLESQTIDAVAVDITFTDAEGTELEPAEDKTVQVQITLPDEMKLSGDEYSLLHISDEGDVQKVEEAEVSETGAEFLAESFSTYVLTVKGKKEHKDLVLLNGQTGVTSADNPYVVYIGETLEVFYQGDQWKSVSITIPNNGSGDATKLTPTSDTWSWDDSNHTYTRKWVATNIGDVTLQQVNPTESIYIRVVQPLSYMIVDGERLPLPRALEKLHNEKLTDEKILYVQSNSKFKISVDGGNEHLIAKRYLYDEHGDPIYEYDTEDGYLHRSSPDYTGGNTTVEFTCLKEGSTTIDVNGETIRVVIGDLAYMKMKDGRRLLLDDALGELNGNTNKEIYAYKDEVLNFSVDGYRFHKITIDPQIGTGVLSKPTNESLGYLYENGNTVVPITCEKEGTGKVVVGDTTITIHVRHPLYVKTNIMDRDIDRVNEWIDGAGLYGNIRENGYIKNSYEHPYYVHIGDEFEIYTNTTDYTSLSFEVLYQNNQSNLLKEITPTVTGTNILSKKYVAQGEGHITITLKDVNGTIRTMYVQVLPDENNLLDHADIEIADGGKYTLTKIKRNQNGTITKTVTEYRAYVNGVNRSTLYSSQDNTKPCQFYESGTWNEDVWTSNPWGNETIKRDPSVTGYREDQYHVNPSIKPGEPQYEFTSKYEPYYKEDENGNLVLDYKNWSNTKYYADDVDHVVFDVKIALEPSKKTVYTKNSNSASWGEGVTTEITATSENTKHLDSVKFNMDHQDVLDAFNKCPNHTGLDFTIMAYSAMVEFDLNKELTGGTVAENQFTFEVLQKEVILARKFAGMNEKLTKSKRNEMSEKGMTFKGAYRIFYDHDTKWGEGIDKDAALREIQATPGFQNLTTAADIFNIVNDDNNPNQAKMKKILKQYLKNPEQLSTTNGDYQVNQNGFYLLSFESEPIQTVQNDASGHITFNALHFEKEDSYKYIIREKVPENTNNILYDRKELDLDITVSKNDKQLTADITSDMTNFKFTNHTTYRLPDTGGKGVIPYTIGGAAMMGAALMLLHRKRKEA